MSCIYAVSFLYMHHYFGGHGYANYLLLDNGSIRPIYVAFQFMYDIFLGTTSRPVGVAYRLYMLVHGYLLFIFMLLLVIFCTEMRMVWFILIFICIVGGRDWPGVRQWRIYMYMLIVSSFGA